MSTEEKRDAEAARIGEENKGAVSGNAPNAVSDTMPNAAAHAASGSVSAGGTAPAPGLTLDLTPGRATTEPPDDAPAYAPDAVPADGPDSAATFAPIPAQGSPGLMETLFNGLSRAGLPVLLLLALLPALHLLFGLYGPDTVQGMAEAGVYASIMQGGWWNLALGGAPSMEPYAGLSLVPWPTAYYWLLYGLDRIPGLDAPAIFSYGAALSGALFCGAIWLLSRAVGQSRREAFAAGLLALGCYALLCALRLPGPDLFTAALTSLSMTCFYRGWRKSSAPLWLTAAFLLIALATLSGGFLPLILALSSSVLFLIWTGRPGRLNGRDGLLGFFLLLFLLGAWIMLLLSHGQSAGRPDGASAYMREVLWGTLQGGLGGPWDLNLPWWGYPAMLAVFWLPWMLLPLFVNWLRVVRALPQAWKGRRENGGRAWLWLWLGIGLAGLCLLDRRSPLALLPLVPPLAALSAGALLKLSPGRSRCFFLLLALLALPLALLLGLSRFSDRLLPLLPPDQAARAESLLQPCLDILPSLNGTLFMGIALFLLAIATIVFLRRALPGGSLLAVSLGLLALFQFQTFLIAPALRAFADQYPVPAEEGEAARSAPGSLPGSSPDVWPDTLPGMTPETPTESLPGEWPGLPPDALPQTAPQTSQDSRPEDGATGAPDDLPNTVPGATPDVWPNELPNGLPDDLPGALDLPGPPDPDPGSAPAFAPNAAPPAADL